MTDSDFLWPNQFRKDIEFGYVSDSASGLGLYSPKLVPYQNGRTVEHAIVEELIRCRSFTFSVAFISAGAIAQLKQHFRDFAGSGRIITSDYLAFNQPRAFEELLNLKEQFEFEVRRHVAASFHPKGYVFEQRNCTTAIIGISNLTSGALSQNHEWNIRVSAAAGDLARQMNDLIKEQVNSSNPHIHEWSIIIPHFVSQLPLGSHMGIVNLTRRPLPPRSNRTKCKRVHFSH